MTIRNAVTRRNHKERSQPSNRVKLGLLEKHKDYIKRAQDYHKKQNTINILKRKAAFKNPDEFYFGMINSTTSKGVHVNSNSSRNQKYDNELLQLLKTQDINYINYKRQINLKQLQELEKGIDLSQTNAQHTIFVDSEKDVKTFDPVKHFNTVPELINQPWNRLTTEALEESNIQPIDETLVSEREKNLGKYASRLHREDKLRKVQMELQVQKNLLGKGPKKKIGVDELGLPVFKWKSQQFHKLSQFSSTIKPPKLLNFYLYKSSPFAIQDSNIFNIPLKQKSIAYESLKTAKDTTDSKDSQDIPLPACIMRHIKHPNSALLSSSAAGKITGFRIQVKGRKGSKSVKQVMSYGKISAGDISRACVDFGKSFYIHKKGASGIKVTIGYI